MPEQSTTKGFSTSFQHLEVQSVAKLDWQEADLVYVITAAKLTFLTQKQVL